jgi:hypothetical protein
MRRFRHVIPKKTVMAPVLALAALALLSPAGWNQARAARADGPETSPAISEAPEVRHGSRPEPVLSAIELLESSSDAKCHSSASRFEDFLYGTPLTDEARREQFELQKRLVQRIWGRASRAAEQAGEETVGPHLLQPQIDELLSRERGSDGQIRVAFPGVAPLTIPTLRADQYASIAYSLRAILAAQQDFLISGGDFLLTLAPEGVDLLRESIDAVTLSALMLADQDAREANESQITVSGVHGVWQRLVPELRSSSSDIPSASESRAPESADSRSQGLNLLDDMIDRKTAAYRAYNDLNAKKTRALFMFNTARFYARAPIPRGQLERRRIASAFNATLDEFTVALLLEADKNARRAGHRLIRADDANTAAQRLIPHAIDDFEDVHLFPRLAVEDRVTLEAYECDSLRDFGIHWLSLKRAAHEAPKEIALPDPLAMEILAETVSQYGVLLLRMAGKLAKQDTDNVRLQPEDLATSAALIQKRARRHRDAPVPPEIGSRIVSAGGDSGGEVREAFFTDVTASTGVDFTHRSSKWLGEFRQKLLKTPPTFSGGGVAAEDVDGDSHIDLLFVGGFGNALLINDGHGRFTDVTQRAGIVLKRPDGSHAEARKPIIADFDNDGLQDILITYVDDDHRLYRNTGGHHFEDVSASSGLGGKGLIGGPATVFDFDGDGLLDVYIGSFGDYRHGAIPTVERDNRNGLPNKLFRNLGGMRFEDVTRGSRTDDRGWAQAVSHVDFDRDGRQDIIVANDYGRNAFFRNLGNGKFEDVAPALGVTKAYHSMNVGISDLNHDGHPDIYVSNLATLVKDDKYVFPDVNTPLNLDLRAMAGMLVKESNVLYMSRVEQGRFSTYEPSKDIERGSTSTGWAWDAEFFDFDHDGDDDLYLVNGTNDYNAFSTVYNNRDQGGKAAQLLLSHSRESNVFFLNEGGKLKNVSGQSGADFVGNSRSTAYLDFDGDGDLDIAINDFHAPAKVFRNNSEKRNLNWLKLRLIGDPSRGSNRDAIGSRILVTTDANLRVSREVQGGSGYLSMNPKQQHFGLGRSGSARVQIIWPDGEAQILNGVAANRSYTVRQGGGIAPDPPGSRTSSGRSDASP